MDIVPLEKRHIDKIVQMHLAVFGDDFIAKLGFGFLQKVFYPQFISSPLGFGYVCLDEEDVVGYVAGSTDASAFYKVLWKKNAPFILKTIFKRIFSDFLLLKSIFSLGSFSLKKKEHIFSRPELSYITVDERSRKKGVADLLVKQVIKHLKEIGFHECWTRTSVDNQPANRLYKKNGFRIVKQLTLRRKIFNLYYVNI